MTVCDISEIVYVTTIYRHSKCIENEMAYRKGSYIIKRQYLLKFLVFLYQYSQRRIMFAHHNRPISQERCAEEIWHDLVWFETMWTIHRILRSSVVVVAYMWHVNIGFIVCGCSSIVSWFNRNFLVFWRMNKEIISRTIWCGYTTICVYIIAGNTWQTGHPLTLHPNTGVPSSEGHWTLAIGTIMRAY